MPERHADDRSALTAAAQEHAKKLEALRRAVPITRMVDYGAPLGDAMEVHRLTEVADAPAWEEACEGLAQRHLERATRAEAEACAHTACTAWREAAALLYCAQLAFNGDEPHKRTLYEAAHAAMQRHARLAGDIEPLELPTPHGPLHGWAVRPALPARAAVLVLGGLSGWGMAYLSMARALAQRGMLAILGEGPGQGLTRLRSGIHLQAQTLTLANTFLDHARAHGAQAVGAWGNSFGGLFVAHLAAADARIQAVCINGAPMVPVMPTFRTFREQMESAFGARSDESLAEAVGALGMSPERHRIAGAMLVVEGGRDPVLALGEQACFFTLAPPERTRLLSWRDGEHTIYNHASERDALVADWFAGELRPH